MIFPANPTNQIKNMTEKQLCAFYEVCMFDVLIHIIRNLMLVQIMFMIQGAHSKSTKQLQI